MKTLKTLLASIVLSALLVTVAAFKPQNQLPGPSINGEGTLNSAYLHGTQHFSFHATKNKAGKASGSFECKSPGQDIRIHGDIDCFNILADGKTAFATGIVTQVVGKGYPAHVGDHVYFKIQDNGEGKKSGGDKFSDCLFSMGNDCSNKNVGLQDISGGNIQVKQ